MLLHMGSFLVRRRLWVAGLLCLLPFATAAAYAPVPLLVADLNPSGSSYPDYVTAVGDQVYFYASSGQTRQFFVSDGSTITQLTALPDGVGHPYPEETEPFIVAADAEAGGAVYFSVDADDNLYVDQLWRTDGTPGGTRLVKDFGGPFYGIYTSGTDVYTVGLDGGEAGACGAAALVPEGAAAGGLQSAGLPTR